MDTLCIPVQITQHLLYLPL